MANIRIKDLPSGVPNPNMLLPMDLTTTAKATIKDVVFAGRPTATQMEAESGTDAEKVMTPLTSRQAIDSRALLQSQAGSVGLDILSSTTQAEALVAVGVDASNFATAAQGAKADSALQPGITTTDVAEGSGLYFTEPRVRATPLTGFSTSDTSSVVAGDTAIAAFGKLQGQVSKRLRLDAVQSATAAEQLQGRDNLGITSRTNAVYLSDCGGIEDGVADDTAAFTAAFAKIGAAGGTVVFQRKPRIASNLTVPKGITIKGPQSRTGTNGNNSVFDYNVAAGIRLVPTAKITLSGGSGLDGVLLLNAALTYPQLNADNFSGQALQVAGDDVFLVNSMLLGFEFGITSNNYQRTIIDNNKFDCLNCIDISLALDVPVLRFNEAWPFTSINQAVNNPSGQEYKAYYRNGTFIKFSNTVDGGRILHNFCYSWQTGYHLNNVLDCVLIDPAYDCTTFPGQNNRAFLIQGFGVRNSVLGGTSGGAWRNFDIDVGSDLTNVINISGHIGYAPSLNTGTGVKIGALTNEAVVHLLHCTFSGFENAIDAFDSPSGITVKDCMFDLVVTPIRTNERSLRKSNITGNRYDTTSTGVADTNSLVNQPAEIRTLAFGAGGGLTITTGLTMGNATTPTDVGTFQALRTDRAQGWVNAAFRDFGKTRFQSAGSVSSTSYSSAWIISTTPSGSTSLVDGIVVEAGGFLKPITDNAYSLGASGARWSSVWAATSTINTSDERQKTEIKDSDLGLDFIDRLRPVSFKFKVGANEVVRQVYRNSEGEEVDSSDDGATPSEIITIERPGTRRHYGLLAQQVKETLDSLGIDDFAGWVLENKDDPDSSQGLRETHMIAPLIKAVQELSQRIKNIESKG